MRRPTYLEVILGPGGPREKYRYLQRYRCLSEAGLRQKQAVVAAIRDFLRNDMPHGVPDTSQGVVPNTPTPIMRLASFLLETPYLNERASLLACHLYGVGKDVVDCGRCGARMQVRTAGFCAACGHRLGGPA